jgi:hypothetical protein
MGETKAVRTDHAQRADDAENGEARVPEEL